jgi:hypothetical protein
MLDENRVRWIEDIKFVATSTLGRINQKAKNLGHYGEEDEAMTNLCMGYLYLLGLCEKNEIFIQEEPNRYLIKDIYKKETIH